MSRIVEQPYQSSQKRIIQKNVQIYTILLKKTIHISERKSVHINNCANNCANMHTVIVHINKILFFLKEIGINKIIIIKYYLNKVKCIYLMLVFCKSDIIK